MSDLSNRWPSKNRRRADGRLNPQLNAIVTLDADVHGNVPADTDEPPVCDES